MEYVASKTGYTLLFSNSYESLEQSKAVVKMVEAQRVEGLIIVGSSLKERDYIYSLIDKGTPFVVIERHYSDPRMNCIWVDNVVGGYVATKHLIQCGHTRVAHISGDLDVEVAAERLKGYKKALDEPGYLFHQTYCLRRVCLGEEVPWDEGIAEQDSTLHSGFRGQ